MSSLPTQQSSLQSTHHTPTNGVRGVIFGVVLAAFLLFVARAVDQERKIEVSRGDGTEQVATQLSEQVGPFYEMTVEYLRNRTYKSELGELETYAQNGSYTSYLSSYDSDGLRVNGLLTIPTGDKPQGGWPAVVFVHGYIPPTIYETTEKYVAYVDRLASSGFVVFKIDLRGNGDSEGEPSGAYYSSDYIVDTLNARAALAASDVVHPDKIGLWGHSMAGNVTMRAFAARPEIPAVVIWAGAVYSYEDFLKYRISDNSYRPPSVATPRASSRQRMFERVGSPSAQSTFWSMVAPTSYVSDLKGALQVHHAVDDDVVDVGYSRDLKATLEKTDVTHEFYEYDTGGHNIDGASFNVAIQRTIDFYKTHLGAAR